MDLVPLISVQVKGSCLWSRRGWHLPPLCCDRGPLRAGVPRGLSEAVFLSMSVNESRLDWSVSEWRGREFSREDFSGQGVVSIIQGKH